MNALLLPTVPRAQRGLSLIEIMVGLVIGVIGILAIFQTVAVWNRHTQTTTSGGDAQVAGTLALFNIERDFKQSGHGFGEAPLPVIGCNVQAFDITGRGAFNFPLRPVQIVVGAAGAPDQLNVLAGSSSFFVEGQDFLSSSPTTKTLRRRGGFKPGDFVVIADAGGALPGSATCKLAEITADNDPDLVTVGHATSAGYTPFASVTPRPSRFDAAQALPAPPFAYTAGLIYNLGQTPQAVNWQVVNNRTLQRTELLFNPANLDQVADGVVNLKAEYGVDVNNDTRIDAAEWLPAIPPANTWKQVLAIRIALLVRSRQFELSRDAAAGVPSPVTTVAPVYFGGPFTMFNVGGGADTFAGAPTTADPNNWRYYRYRVYERVIPLKNMLWALP